MTVPVLDLRRLSEGLGAEVLNLDAARLAGDGDPALTDALLAALDRHLVLLFGGVSMTPEALERFGARFGQLFTDRVRGDGSDGSATRPGDAIKTIGNTVDGGGEMAGSFGAEAQVWHTDGNQREQPNAYSLLYGVVAPPEPPRTFWLSAYTLYERLPERLKEEIAGLYAVHSRHGRSQGFWKFHAPSPLTAEQRAEGPRHPLVRRHPRTGRPSLYLPRRRDALIEGWSAERSRVLLERLWAQVAIAEDPIGLPLAAGDMVIFDNRVTLHAREGWESSAPRAVMHLGIGGEPVEPAFAAPFDPAATPLYLEPSTLKPFI